MAEPVRLEAMEYTHEAWLKHLEFIQAIIARLANNSFLMKGWALTVGGALFGFAASHLSWGVAAVGLLPVACFWYLDSYFLMQERLYRMLYNRVAKNDPDIPKFSLDPSRFRSNSSWALVLVSRTLLTFYGVLMASGLVLTVALAAHQLAD